MSGTHGLRPDAESRLRSAQAPFIAAGRLPGCIALLARGDDLVIAAMGSPAFDDPAPLRRDAIFRIASITKPMVAAATMMLVDDGTIALADPVTRWLPELAGRRVLRTLESELNDTVPAEREITVEDLLTCRLGYGSIMAPPDSFPVQRVEAALELRTSGSLWPLSPWTSDEWIARFAMLPLLAQPGSTWHYQTGIQVLGILLERVSGQRLGDFLHDRLFAPLGMRDTAFTVPAAQMGRFTTAYMPDGDGLAIFDAPRTGMWSALQAKDDASGMVVATLDDLWTFVAMLGNGGVHDGQRLVSTQSLAALTTNHLTRGQRSGNELFLGSHGGWGYGMAAPVEGDPGPQLPRGYGWDGGTGTTWRTDPETGLVAILLTQVLATSPEPSAVMRAFWEAASASLPDGVR